MTSNSAWLSVLGPQIRESLAEAMSAPTTTKLTLPRNNERKNAICELWMDKTNVTYIYFRTGIMGWFS